ncbi:hypothetical protein D3C78_1674940 [compost metagenome]
MALRPISCRGWRTVVSGGSKALANMMSSKPMTETSDGTDRPLPRNSLIAPIAIWSLDAKIAVKAMPFSRRPAIA